jgi:hypothetical protein
VVGADGPHMVPPGGRGVGSRDGFASAPPVPADAEEAGQSLLGTSDWRWPIVASTPDWHSELRRLAACVPSRHAVATMSDGPAFTGLSRGIALP